MRVRSARGVSGGALHQDEMGGGRGEDGATYRCRVNGVAGERREEGARKRPTRRHCAVRMLKFVVDQEDTNGSILQVTLFRQKSQLETLSHKNAVLDPGTPASSLD